MDEVSTNPVIWRKSTRSNGSGDCVEVADLAGTIGVRDSKDPAGPILTFSPSRFTAFVEVLKEHPASS